MSELLTIIVGIGVAVLIAKMFLNDLEKEIAAHDDSSIVSDNDDDR